MNLLYLGWRAITGLSKNFIFAVCVGLYLTAATFVFAGNNAQYQWECHHKWPAICDDNMVAQDRGTAAMMALIPPGWLVSFFFTGGFYHGLSFDATPHVYRHG